MVEVKAGEFVEVMVDSLEKDGIPKGSYLYLAGDTFVPVEGEAYKFEKVFIAARIKDNHINTDEKPFLVSGKSLMGLPEMVSKVLIEQYEKDFCEEGETSSNA